MLREILSGEVTENVVGKIHDLLISLGERVRSGAVPLEDFIIFKVSRFCGMACSQLMRTATREEPRRLSR